MPKPGHVASPLASLNLVEDGEGVAVSITWFQTQLILTTCQIRYLGSSWHWTAPNLDSER